MPESHTGRSSRRSSASTADVGDRLRALHPRQLRRVACADALRRATTGRGRGIEDVQRRHHGHERRRHDVGGNDAGRSRTSRSRSSRSRSPRGLLRDAAPRHSTAHAEPDYLIIDGAAPRRARGHPRLGHDRLAEDGAHTLTLGTTNLADDLWEQNAQWWQDGFTDGADPEYEEQILPLDGGVPRRRAARPRRRDR